MLDGFGGMGEGMSLQIAPDGRRVMWLAHESAPKNFTAVDVTDPKKPKVIVQTDLPHAKMRSNSLSTRGCGERTQTVNLEAARFVVTVCQRRENWPKGQVPLMGLYSNCY